MIALENVNEYISNMRFKKSFVGGVKEESVYENMRKLSDLYEQKINEMTEQIKSLKDETLNLTQDNQELIEIKDRQQEEIKRTKRNYVMLLQSHQSKISQFMEACVGFSDEISKAVNENQ
jgi:hypothetical protein